jgi:drug/metabolite transporter (DMT)-like permease
VGIRGRDGLWRHDALAGLAEGTSRAGPAIAAVLLNTAPFFVAVIGRLALHERVTTLRALGLVIGFAGVLTIILAGNSSSGEDIAIGVALTLLGAVGYGSSGLLMRYLSLTGEPLDVMGLAAAQFLCGAVLLVPYLFLSGDVGASDWGSLDLWWSIAFIVIGAQVVAYLTFYVALTRWPSSRVYPWTFLSPVVAILIEAIRGSLPSVLATVGMAIVVAGLIVVNLPRAEARDAIVDRPAPEPIGA